MENKNARPGGRPGTGNGETNRLHYTILLLHLQAVDACLLPLTVIIDRVVGEVVR